MKFATELIWHRPPHLKNVATIPWEIKIQISANIQLIWKKMQTNCILIASNFVIRPQILMLLLLKMGCLSTYSLQIKFFLSPFFWLFTFAVNLCTGNLSQQTSLQCLSTINMVFSDEDKILIKSLYLTVYTTKRLTNEFPEKRWTKRGVNKLLQTLRDTGTVYRRPEIWMFNFPR